MGALRGALRTGIALKAFEMLRREAAKPENQEKAKVLARKVAERVNQRKGSRPPAA
jgi:hypothetical protein